MKPKAITSMRISRQMHAIEDETDRLLSRVSETISEVSTARVDYDVDANEMQRVLARLASAQSALIEVRMKAIGAHSDLRKFAEPKADYPISCPEQKSAEADDYLKVVG